jgi:hypothetical protein
MKELTILGKGIRMNDNELVSLTDLWKAAGGNNVQRPSLWVKHEGAMSFMLAVAKKLNVATGYVCASKPGRFGGGTWAHWQIALAYAKYLSPELHMAVNEVFKQFMEADTALAESVLERSKDQRGILRVADKAVNKLESKQDLEWIAARADARQGQLEVMAVASKYANGDKTVFGKICDTNNEFVTGKRTRQLREEFGIKGNKTPRDYFKADQLTELQLVQSWQAQKIIKDSPRTGPGVLKSVYSVIDALTQAKQSLGIAV